MDESTLQTFKREAGLAGESRTLERAFVHARARALARSGQWLQARDAYLALVDLDPDEPWVYWDLAEVFQMLEARDDAAAAFLTAADKHLGRGQTDHVLRAYQQAAAVSPNDPAVQAKLGDPAAPPTASRPRPTPAPSPAPAPPPHDPPPSAPPAPAPPAAPPSPKPERSGPAPAASVPPVTAPPGAEPPAPGRAPRTRLGGKTETLGQVLLQLGIITQQQLAEALEIQSRTGERIGQILRDMGAVSDQDLARGMAHQWGYPYMSLAEAKINPEVAKLVPHALAVRHKCIALDRRNGRLVVAIADPLNVIAVDDVRLITGAEVDLVVATEEDITNALARVYQLADNLIDRAIRESVTDYAVEFTDEDASVEQLRALTEEAPVVKLVNLIIDEAIKQNASDIHVEPHRNGMWIRYRVDGVLRDVMNPPKHLKAALVSRMKIMAEMDIAERRRPQDGRVHLTADGRTIDLRVSTLPTMFGEKVVLRILDQSSALLGLSRLGFPSGVLQQWEAATSTPHGMVLVTGPTGSGKTTTLYATLSKLNTLDRNIVTVEDPVEYQIPRINQVQVNVKAGLTFASGLRSILRQDPDIVMVGEIRDRETAEIAVQAALTGHLVLSTLHTNDAAGAVTRMVDMGVEPFLISSSLIAVLAQRLARAICPRCKVAYTPPADALRRLGADAVDGNVVFYRGQGCDHCRGTGYRGRIGIFELLMITDSIRKLIVERASSTEIKAQAIREGMRTLREDAFEKVLSGVSTIDEILRVVYVQE
ncbi:MAG: type II secretion system ATPase GspE [Armatimonadota bacterium]|nr:type II secretion system ATPase GspE [Armatimonadota bacterium]